MEKTDWQSMKTKFKKAFDRSVKALKEGGEEARYMAGQTAHALQLEMDIYGLRHKVTKLTQKFGETVHKQFGNGKTKITTEIRKLGNDLTELKKALKRKESEMRRLHLRK